MNYFELSCLADFFYKHAAIKFPEELSWVPEELREHKLLKDYPKDEVEKVFKDYGLDDFRAPINMSDFSVYSGLYAFIKNIMNEYTVSLKTCFRDYYENKQEEVPRFDSYSIAPEDSVMIDVIDFASITDQFATEMVSLMVSDSSSLKITKNIRAGKIRYDAGASIIKIYNSIGSKLIGLNSVLSEVLSESYFNFIAIEETEAFKAVSEYQSKANSVKENYTLVFSTKLKDLVGISARGINSCQSVADEKGNCIDIHDDNQRLIGTILSRYVGVCYLTNGEQMGTRGEKMVFRALIRQALDLESEKPYIMVDKLKPSINPKVYTIMQEELQKHSSIPVLIADKIEQTKYFIPDEDIPHEYSSYRDIDYTYTLNQLLGMARSSSFKEQAKAAQSLPIEYLPMLINSPSIKVRVIVAQRIAPEYLVKMISDNSELVREDVVRRIDPKYLHYMLADNSYAIVSAVVARIDPLQLKEIISKDEVEPAFVKAIAHNLSKSNPSSTLELYSLANNIIRQRLFHDLFRLRGVPEQFKNYNFIKSLMQIEMSLSDTNVIQQENITNTLAVKVPEVLSAPEFLNNKNEDIKRIVALRIPTQYLSLLDSDLSDEVRLIINVRKERLQKASA